MVGVRAVGKFPLPFGLHFMYDRYMSKSITVRQKKRGRPATGHDPMFSFRIPEALIAEVDEWGAAQEPPLTRSEAVRRLIEKGVKKGKKS